MFFNRYRYFNVELNALRINRSHIIIIIQICFRVIFFAIFSGTSITFQDAIIFLKMSSSLNLNDKFLLAKVLTLNLVNLRGFKSLME